MTYIGICRYCGRNIESKEYYLNEQFDTIIHSECLHEERMLKTNQYNDVRGE